MSEMLYGYSDDWGLSGTRISRAATRAGRPSTCGCLSPMLGPIVVPAGVEDDKVLFLSDILPTGWMAAENCEIEPGDTVAVWGCGPVGLVLLFRVRLALGAERVIAVDHYPHRLELAKNHGRRGGQLRGGERYERHCLK